jgi:hypothetical protein
MAQKPPRRRTYCLTDEERRITPNGPALIAPRGERKELPMAAYEALDHVLRSIASTDGCDGNADFPVAIVEGGQ